MIAECAALVSEVPTFMLPIWATKRSVTTSSGRTSERRSRKPAKRPVTHAQSTITTPPTTKRIQARRNGDALLHVVRAFADEALGAADPRRDIGDLETELLLADLEVVERRLERLEASIGKQRKEPEIKERDLLVRIKAGLESERPLRA